MRFYAYRLCLWLLGQIAKLADRLYKYEYHYDIYVRGFRYEPPNKSDLYQKALQRWAGQEIDRSWRDEKGVLHEH